VRGEELRSRYHIHQPHQLQVSNTEDVQTLILKLVPPSVLQQGPIFLFGDQQLYSRATRVLYDSTFENYIPELHKLVLPLLGVWHHTRSLLHAVFKLSFNEYLAPLFEYLQLTKVIENPEKGDYDACAHSFVYAVHCFLYFLKTLFPKKSLTQLRVAAQTWHNARLRSLVNVITDLWLPFLDWQAGARSGCGNLQDATLQHLKFQLGVFALTRQLNYALLTARTLVALDSVLPSVRECALSLLTISTSGRAGTCVGVDRVMEHIVCQCKFFLVRAGGRPSSTKAHHALTAINLLSDAKALRDEWLEERAASTGEKEKVNVAKSLRCPATTNTDTATTAHELAQLHITNLFNPLQLSADLLTQRRCHCDAQSESQMTSFAESSFARDAASALATWLGERTTRSLYALLEGL